MHEIISDRIEEGRKRTIRLLGGVAGVGLVASVGYGAQFAPPKFFSVVATALIVACGSAMGGSLLGFIFALPRGRRSEPRAPEQPPGTAVEPSTADSYAEREAATRPNTNLDDISDWLTKILVGVGLVQLSAIGDALGRLSSAMAPSLGGADSSPAFALALIATFASTGFLVGYLWTRFYIPAALERAESDVRAELRALRQEAAQTRKESAETKTSVEELAAHSGRVIESTATRVEDQVAEAMRQLGRGLPAASAPMDQTMEQAKDLAAEYERVRRSMPAGPARTFELSRIVSRVRGSANDLHLASTQIRELFEEGPGGRIVALGLIAEAPSEGLVDLVRRGISEPGSAFEQYQALQAARSLIERTDLPQPERRSLRVAIEEQMRAGEGRYITRDSERWTLAEEILRML